MRLYQQLVLFMLAATVLPLVVVGFWLLRTSERELATQIGNEQRALASLAAERSSEKLGQLVDAVGKTVELVDWAATTDEEKRGALSLVYSTSEWITAAALVTPEGEVTHSVYTTEVSKPGSRFAFKPEELGTLKAAVPLAALGAGERGAAALSEPYSRLDKSVAVALAVRTGAEPSDPFVLVEVSLAPFVADLRSRVSKPHALYLFNKQGKLLATSDDAAALLSDAPKDLWSVVNAGLSASPRGVSTLAGVEGKRELVGAALGDSRFSFIAVARVNEADALAPVRAMRRTVLFGIGAALLVLLALGALFTRRINSRLGTVVKGVEALGKGDLGTRVPVSGSDELTELATTFNSMGAELEKARAKLLTWNEELKQKVEEATADLRAAQAQLVEAQKLAAVGQLGAGVAHEINNPLAGILGNAQLLMLDMDNKHPDFETLRKIEASAKRCKEITQNLLRFSQQKDKMEPRPIDLNGVIRDALKMSATQTTEEGVAIHQELSGQPIRVNGDPGQLVQVVVAMIANGRTAMMKSAQKQLVIRTHAHGNEGVIEIEDHGKGIKPEHLPRIFEPFFTTKDVWTNVGLGLSVAYRVVNEHKGKIDVKTEVGKGSTFVVRLPLYDARQKVDPRPAVVEAPKAGSPLSWTQQ